TEAMGLTTLSGRATVTVWHSLMAQPHGGPLRETARQWGQFSEDGRSVLRWSEDGTVWVHDAADGRPVLGPLPNETGVRSAALSRDGRRLLVHAGDSSAVVWDVPSARSVVLPGRATEVLLSPDGRHVLTTSENEARVWDAATGQPVTPPLAAKEVNPTAPQGFGAVTPSWMRGVFSPDGRRVLLMRGSGVRVWDLATGRPLTSPLRHGQLVRYAPLRPDGRRLLTETADPAVFKSGAPQVRVWDVSDGRPLTPPLPHDPGHASFSPDGRLLLTTQKRAVRVWDAGTGQAVTP